MRLAADTDVDWGSERLPSPAAGADSTISRLNDGAGLCGWCTLLGSYPRYIHFDPQILKQTSMHIYTISSTNTQNKINGDCTVI
jgi:hypothetical protein